MLVTSTAGREYAEFKSQTVQLRGAGTGWMD